MNVFCLDRADCHFSAHWLGGVGAAQTRNINKKHSKETVQGDIDDCLQIQLPRPTAPADFLDAPPAETLIKALEQLYALGALNDQNHGFPLL